MEEAIPEEKGPETSFKGENFVRADFRGVLERLIEAGGWSVEVLHPGFLYGEIKISHPSYPLEITLRAEYSRDDPARKLRGPLPPSSFSSGFPYWDISWNGREKTPSEFAKKMEGGNFWWK